MNKFKVNTIKTFRRCLPALAAVLVLGLAGCVQPYNNTQPNRGGSYGTSYGNNGGYGSQSRSCATCGRVQDVRQVYVDSRNNNSSHALGTIIGAVVGGALGNQVGKGDGRKAATVAGAVAGGFAGNQVAKHEANGSNGRDVGYRVTVRLDDGRTATVTQRDNPQVRVGDYVIISNNHVYER